LFFKLNKNGEILTQAEYESIQTDVAIGRENRRKIDDTIMEVYVILRVTYIYEEFFFFIFYRLNDMAREHWAHVHKYTEKLEKDLLYQFGRIQVNFYNYKNTFYSIHIGTISSTCSTGHHSTWFRWTNSTSQYHLGYRNFLSSYLFLL
jgi:hypothetical protein